MPNPSLKGFIYFPPTPPALHEYIELRDARRIRNGFQHMRICLPRLDWTLGNCAAPRFRLEDQKSMLLKSQP